MHCLRVVWTVRKLPDKVTRTDSLNRLTNVDYGNGSIISYTYDPAGNRVTYSAAVAGDTNPPTIAILGPTSDQSFTNSTATINLSGTASDNTGVSLVTWSNDRGGVGTASGTTNWIITAIPLQFGANAITVTIWDYSGNKTQSTLRVTYNPPDTTAPVLSISTPTTGQAFTSSPIVVTGSASDTGSGLASVAINTGATNEGTLANWRFTVNLNPGPNTVVVSATDQTGNTGSVQIIATLVPYSYWLGRQLPWANQCTSESDERGGDCRRRLT